MRWMRGFFGLTLFLGLIVACEAAYRCLAIEEALAKTPLDIQCPSQLLVKLDYLRKFDGYKVVLIGDSIVYGGILKDYGDENWREHTLDALLQEKYATRFPDGNVLVMNLGINGALPEDMECITKLVGACHADVLVFSTQLRPFAADFENDHEAMARPWLREIAAGEDGSFRYHPTEASWKIRANLAIGDLLGRQFSFVRHRDTIHTMLPSAAKSRIETDRVTGLMMIKSRFQTVRVEDDHRQLKALRRTLDYLKGSDMRAAFFYVKEHPEDLDAVIDEDVYRRHYANLAKVYREFAGPNLDMIAPIPELMPKHFLDFSHLNHEGYLILTDYLWKSPAVNR